MASYQIEGYASSCNIIFSLFIGPFPSAYKHALISFILKRKPLGFRQIGTWDPLLQCLYLDTPLLKQWNTKIQNTSYKGLKITVCTVQLGQIMDKKIQKDQKPKCHFWRAGSKNRGSGEKAGHCTCPLHTAAPKGRADHLSLPSSLTPGHTPAFTSYK